MPKNNEKYNEIYNLMTRGTLDTMAYNLETGKNEVVISGKQIRKECAKRNVEFNDFMKYAQKRKAEENAKNQPKRI